MANNINKSYIKFGKNTELGVSPEKGYEFSGDSNVASKHEAPVLQTKYSNIDHVAYYDQSSEKTGDIIIYRKKIGDTNWSYQGVIREDKISKIFDYNLASNDRFQYLIQTGSGSTLTDAWKSKYVNVHWKDWSLIDLDYIKEYDIYRPSGLLFTFKNNIQAGTISNNFNTIQNQTLGRFAKIIQNKQHFDSGTLSFTLGDFFVCQNKIGNYYVETLSDTVFDNADKNSLVYDDEEGIYYKFDEGFDFTRKHDTDGRAQH